jgi:two-component system LytT family response regulator
MLSCLIIDDEPLAIKLLLDYVNKTDGLELINTFSNPIEGLQFLGETPVDLVFLDIQMPELTGIQFMKIMNKKTNFILTTAYNQYALEGYEFDVIDYLLKPISLERFIIATNKAKDRILSKETLPQPLQSVQTSIDYIFVKTEYKVKKINLSDILYFEGMGDYINIQTPTEKILTLENIKSFSQRLPKNKFIRVHKSYIISLEKINFIERNRIIINEKYIPIGNTYQERFWEKINGK